MRKLSLLLFILLVTIPGCAKKLPPISQTEAPGYELEDIRQIPQDLEIFAQEYGRNKRLLSGERQEELASNFINIWAGPWQMRRTSISRREAGEMFGRAWGYKENSIPWIQSEMDALKANANMGAYPSRQMAAITVRGTDLRALPTSQPRYKNPVAVPATDPFDYLQYSFLPIGTPLLIAHTSADGKWHYVECPIAGGWVKAEDTALASQEFQKTWLTGRYAALIRENVPIPGIGPGDASAGIGTILPVVKEKDQQIYVLAPFREKNGYAASSEIMLAENQATIQPMPMTAANAAKVGNALLGQKYGWGGMLGLRDCSAMIRDLFTPFGIWLPRNSRAQSRRGAVVSLEDLSWKEKEQIILKEGIPFLSLVGMPGHITLYVGTWKNRPCVFHNVWGVRVIKDGNDDERFVIGRAVITTITPGMELENLYRTVTFADRIRTLTTTRNAH